MRVYRNALLYGSDLLAELDLPQSGIVDFEESVDLPGEFREQGVHEDVDLEGKRIVKSNPQVCLDRSLRDMMSTGNFWLKPLCEDS